MKVGWIGAGRMGQAMVERLLHAGVPVRVWNRTRAKADALAGRGADVVDAIADLAGCDLVGVTVAADDDLRAVTVGNGGLLRQGTAPRYLVDFSTVSVATSAAVRGAAGAVGTALLAAPVSGNPSVVRGGTASIAVSGPADAFDAVRETLEHIGQSTVYVGDGDVARLVKVAHNVLLGILAQGLAEVTVLAERGGVPRGAFLEFLNGSVLGSPFSRYKTPALVDLDFTPTFTTALLRKDLELGLAAARESGLALPLAAQAAQQVQAAIGRGHRDEDFAALIVEVAANAGLTLEKPALEKPAPEKSALEKPAAEKSALEKPALEKSALEKSALVDERTAP